MVFLSACPFHERLSTLDIEISYKPVWSRWFNEGIDGIILGLPILSPYCRYLYFGLFIFWILSLFKVTKSPQQGAATTVWATVTPDVEQHSGRMHGSKLVRVWVGMKRNIDIGE